ncbi:MAG: M12 family metallo-peptidase, partial [Verrucomicrobia bacterium]|nr:M12 family metallo-peptidase [Verrucomicrobiota bacterium]
MTNWIKLLLFFLLSWCTPVFGQLIQPTTVTISNSTYQLIYKDKLVVNKPVSAFIQNKSGMQGMATFFFNTNNTTARIQLGNNNFNLRLTSTSTNIQWMPPYNLNCGVVTNVPTGKKLVMSKKVLATSNAPVNIDLLVVYTPEASLYLATNYSGWDTNIVTTIKKNVEVSNKMLADSQVYVKINLVGIVALSNYVSTSSLRAELDKLTNPADGYLDEVPTLRNQYSADMVQMVSQPKTMDAGGWAWIGYPPQDGYCYSVVCPIALVDYGVPMVHELGHNFGCNHDFKNASAGLPYSYGYSFGEAFSYVGWTDGLTKSVPWKTIMSYNGADCGLFSNPNINFLGMPVGTATNNNALVINQNAATIAAYRAAPNYTLTLTKNGTGSV